MASPLDQLDDSGSSIVLNAALRVLRKRMWLIVGLAIVVPAVVGAHVSKEPKVYEATVSIEIRSSAPRYLGRRFKDVESQDEWWSRDETLQTELQRLQSRAMGLAVAQSMCAQTITLHGKQMNGLQATFGEDAGECDDKTIDAYADGLRGVRVDPITDSRVVLMSAQSSEPEVAALLANTTAKVYEQLNLERRQTQSEGATRFLDDEYGDLATQINDAERALIDFKKKNNVVVFELEDQQNERSSRRKKLADELGSIQVRLIALKAQRSQYSQLKTSDPLTDITPGVSDSAVMVKLKELYIDQYAKLVELKGKYLDKHPTVIAQEARVQAVREDMKREASMAAKNDEAQFEMLSRQARDLKSSLDVATQYANGFEEKAIGYNKLKRNLDHLVKISARVGGREHEQAIAGHLKTNNVSIVDLAQVPTEAITPNVPRAVGMAFAVALLLGLGLSILIEIFDSTVKSQEDVERAAGAAFLGLIPSIVDEPSKHGVARGVSGISAPPTALAEVIRAGSKDLYPLTHPRSAVAECYRAIRTNLLFMTPDKPAKTLLVTSASPQEGKSITAINLAVTIAQSGQRVLLVDTDMRRPRLHKAFGIPSNGDGLSRAIVGDGDVMESIRETGVPGLSLLPCGPCPINPAELLHAERFAKIVRTLGDHFDRVIFDSPPIGAVTDAAILARIADGTILVAKGGQTRKAALTRASKQINGDGVTILGVILNDLTKPDSYGYSYYDYSTNYSYGEDTTAGELAS